MAGLVQQISLRAPWGLRRAVERDRKRDGLEDAPWLHPDTDFVHFLPDIPAEPAPLDALLPGHEEANDKGTFWLAWRPMHEFWAGGRLTEGVDTDSIYFDLEAGGGRGKPLFLVGASLWDEQEGWMLWHGLARAPEEEPALLAAFADLCRSRPKVVSYSGIKNDWPFLRHRWDHFGQAIPQLEHHLDLFDLAQDRYRGVLPTCRLVTLEKFLLGRYREDDLPSGLIPLSWEDFLHTGDARLLAQILHHNLLDVISLLELQPILDVPFSPLPVPPSLIAAGVAQPLSGMSHEA